MNELSPMRRIARGALCAVAVGLPVLACAQQQGGARDPVLEQELRYYEALMKLRMPDYAELVLADIKKAFPQAANDLKRFSIEPLLQQGKFDEVKAIIAREADQESEATWSMRLMLADYYYGFGRYPEALGVYEGFFKKYAGKPPEGIAVFYRESAYKYAQMLLFLKQEDAALKAYRDLLTQPLENHVKRQIQFEAAELMVRLGKAMPPKSEARKKMLADARKACEDILWQQDLWFGRGIVLLAHIQVIEGEVEKAQKLITTYMPQLKQIDDALKAEGEAQGEDLSRLSPVAECRYLIGIMLHDEAKKLLDGENPSKEDLDRARDLLIGTQGADGKGTNGAYQELLNVFVRFPGTSWAPDAAARVDEIEETLRKHALVRSIEAKITAEQRAEVARRQFQNARLLFNQQQFENAIEVYLNVLRQFPESVPDSVTAISELARCYIELSDPGDAATRIHELHADTVTGYLAERFCRNPKAMTAAGDELRRIADLYAERKQEDKRRGVYDLFFTLYAEHAMAAPMLMSFAERSFQAEDWPTALGYYGRLAADYTNSPLSYDALNRIAQVYRKQGDATNEIATLTQYAARLEGRAKPGQELVTARFLLAQASRSLHQPNLRAEDPEAVKAANAGVVQAANLYGSVLRMLEPAEIDKYQTSDDEKKRNQTVREGALFGRAYCMSVLTQPADKLADLKKQAILTYEEMLKSFPQSEFAPGVLMQIGTLWTTLGEADPESTKKADEAFTRLSQQFPDSTEAKLALFQRAKILIELGYRSQGVTLLKQMFQDTARYTAAQMLTVGQELLKSKEYEMALQAFDVALAGAKDNDSVRMPAMLGRTDVLIAQDKVAEAVDLLDKFLQSFKRSALTIDANLKLSHAASALAVTLDDREARTKMFNKAVEAMKLVRQFRTEPGDLARTDNDIGRILLRKAEAERRLREDAREKEYTMQAVGHFVSVLDSGNPTIPEVVQHLEESYFLAIPLMIQLKEFGDAKEYAERYTTLFPSGRYLTDIRNWLNEASIGLTSR